MTSVSDSVIKLIKPIIHAFETETDWWVFLTDSLKTTIWLIDLWITHPVDITFVLFCAYLIQTANSQLKHHFSCRGAVCSIAVQHNAGNISCVTILHYSMSLCCINSLVRVVCSHWKHQQEVHVIYLGMHLFNWTNEVWSVEHALLNTKFIH